MKTRLKKYISLFLLVLIITASLPLNTFAYFSDVPANAAYTDALNRLTSLGVITAAEKFNPDGKLTREQFAKMMVVAAGLESKADSLKVTSMFADVAENSWSCGYINVALNQGYMAGMPDGNFHPAEPITFAQICTVLVKALGYTDQDVTGNWPANYITKAMDLGLADGITLGKNDSLTRATAVTMIDRLLDSNMKTTSAAAEPKTFLDTTGSFIKCIVFGDSTTNSSLSEGHVLTDKGIFNNPLKIKIEVGTENYITVKNGNIQKASAQAPALKVSVNQATEYNVSYRNGETDQSMMLPNNVTYYYNGQKLDYTKLPPLLQKSASIVFNYNADKTGYDFAVVFDPVYSKPEIADSFVSSGKLGSITFGVNPLIIRNGDIVSISEIEPKDVVYQVTDIWGGNKYYQAVYNQISGKISNVTPNRLSPKTLQIDSVNYDFSKSIDMNKITSSYDLSIGNNIIAYLGYDGKIANIEDFGTQDYSNYALVLNTSTSVKNSNGVNVIKYNAKLLFGNGTTATYYTESNSSGLKGSLVKYTLTSSDTVTLETIPYVIQGETSIDKSEKLLGQSYVADNVKIFDIVNNDSSSDVQANILKWNDLPNGTIPRDKIWCIKTAGDFNDVSLIVTDDILNQRYKLGYVVSITRSGNSSQYTILVGSTEYKYTTDSSLPIGSVVKFKMKSSGIDSVNQIMSTNITTSSVQAIDGRRIKINGAVYYFNNDFSIYYKDSNGNVTVKTPSDIDKSESYQKISLYTYDMSSDGKISVVLIDK